MTSLGRVLIVDDEPGLRHTFARILQKIGCEVNTAADGVEALRLLNGANYDLVYLDIRLPGMDGLAVLSQIRQLTPDLQVILLTGHGSLQTAMQALRLGASDYLLKPVDPEGLVIRTQKALGQQAIEKRKLWLRGQILSLEEELKTLEASSQETLELYQVESPTPSDERYFQRGSMVIDLHAHRVTLGADVLSIPPTSFEYLVVLARHSPKVVDFLTMVVEAQKYQVAPAEARQLAKYHIHVLRQALNDDPLHPQYLHTIRGVGYKLLLN